MTRIGKCWQGPAGLRLFSPHPALTPCPHPSGIKCNSNLTWIKKEQRVKGENLSCKEGSVKICKQFCNLKTQWHCFSGRGRCCQYATWHSAKGVKVEISSPFLLPHHFVSFYGTLGETGLRARVEYCPYTHTRMTDKLSVIQSITEYSQSTLRDL